MIILKLLAVFTAVCILRRAVAGHTTLFGKQNLNFKGSFMRKKSCTETEILDRFTTSMPLWAILVILLWSIYLFGK